MKIGTVYCITNLVNNRKYIGITTQLPSIRWAEHLRSKKGCTKLLRAFNKYDKQNFTFEIIYQTLDMLYMNDMEAYFIQKFNTLGKNGYNIDPGGRHYERTEEYCKSLSKALKGIDRSNLKKPLLRINKKTGEIKEYDSLVAAGEAGYDMRSIRAVTRGYRNSVTHAGFAWCYKEDFDSFSVKYPGRSFKSVKYVDKITGEMKEYSSIKSAKDDGFTNVGIHRSIHKNIPYKNKVWWYL